MFILLITFDKRKDILIGHSICKENIAHGSKEGKGNLIMKFN